MLDLNQAGIVSSDTPFDLGSPPPPVSTNDWKVTPYTSSANFSVDNFISYIKARKKYKKIADWTEINPADTLHLYLIEGDKTITNAEASKDPLVLIVDGNLTLTDPFNPAGAKDVALLVTGELRIPDSMSELNGLYIANTVDLGTGGKLKVIGNLISETPIDMSTRSNGVNNTAPALFVKFDPKYYLTLLPYLSTSNYEWRQLQ